MSTSDVVRHVPVYGNRRPIMEVFSRVYDAIAEDKIMKIELDMLTECVYILGTKPGVYIRIKHVRVDEVSEFMISNFDDVMIPVIVDEVDWELVGTMSTVGDVVGYVKDVM